MKIARQTYLGSTNYGDHIVHVQVVEQPSTPTMHAPIAAALMGSIVTRKNLASPDLTSVPMYYRQGDFFSIALPRPMIHYFDDLQVNYFSTPTAKRSRSHAAFVTHIHHMRHCSDGEIAENGYYLLAMPTVTQEEFHVEPILFSPLDRMAAYTLIPALNPQEVYEPTVMFFDLSEDENIDIHVMTLHEFVDFVRNHPKQNHIRNAYAAEVDMENVRYGWLERHHTVRTWFAAALDVWHKEVNNGA